MENHLDTDLTFAGGLVANKKLVVIVAEQDKYIQSKPHSFLFFYQGDKWSKMLVEFPIVSLCRVNNDLIALGVDGRVQIANPQGRFTEKILEGGEGPDVVGTMSQVRAIDSVPHAIGMGRQAYRRMGENAWIRVDQGVRQPIEDEEVRGFISIDGFNTQDIYAVGYAGEIWHFDGTAWTRMPSPTNLALHAVRCTPNGDVYIAGQCGILLRGSGTQWSVVAEGETPDHFWGCETLDGEVYVSTNRRVYALQSGHLTTQEIGLDLTGAAGKLDANDGVLWSFGSKFLSYKSGPEWHPVNIPRV